MVKKAFPRGKSIINDVLKDQRIIVQRVEFGNEIVGEESQTLNARVVRNPFINGRRLRKFPSCANPLRLREDESDAFYGAEKD